MFTDHMYFSWVTEMVWCPALLILFAVSYRARFLTALSLQPAPASSDTKYFSTSRNCAARVSSTGSENASIDTASHVAEAIGQTPITSCRISLIDFQKTAECFRTSLPSESPHTKTAAFLLNSPRHLFPLGHSAPATGKEDTSC